MPETTPLITCPRCGASALASSTRCPTCGVNLALAVARANAERLQARRDDLELVYEADKHLPRFGEFLFRNGDIIEAQLTEALQRQQNVPGHHRTLGQVLLEMGAVNREQLDRASVMQIREFQTALYERQERLTAQGERILQLEELLVELASLNESSAEFVGAVADRLKTAVDMLKDMGVTTTASASVFDDLDKAISDLAQYASGEKK